MPVVNLIGLTSEAEPRNPSDKLAKLAVLSGLRRSGCSAHELHCPDLIYGRDRPLDRGERQFYFALMSNDDHDHHHDHSELSETELRVRALETVLTAKGYIDPAALDLLIETYETKVGPRNGARVVAKAWTDSEFYSRLMSDATSAIAELDYAGRQGEHIVAVENTVSLHNMVVCTLCSCYPWPVDRKSVV